MSQRVSAALISALAFVGTEAAAADIKVFSDTPLAPALRSVGEAFRRASGLEAKYEFGLSPAIHKRVLDGEPGDVVIVQPNFLDDLIKAGRVIDGPRSAVARVGIGLFTRAGSETPDISTVAAFKQALLNADTFVFSNVAAGNYFATVLDRLGIADAVRTKVVRANPSDVVARVVEGTGKDVGVLVVTLVLADKRLKLVGTLPSELQSYLVYAAAPMTSSHSLEPARQFIAFLGSTEAKKAFGAAGAE